MEPLPSPVLQASLDYAELLQTAYEPSLDELVS